MTGLLACVPFTEVHAEDTCLPKLVTELFFSDGEVPQGIYLGLQMIDALPKYVTENPRIRIFLSGNKDSTLMPLIVVGRQAPSSNYNLQIMPQENGVRKIVWVQRSFSDTGLMVLGYPMWLGLWKPQCEETIMIVN